MRQRIGWGRLRFEAGVAIFLIAIGLFIATIGFLNGRVRTIFEVAERSRRSRRCRVVNGTGRIANVDHIDFDAGKVQHDKGHIVVDKYLNSKSNPAVYVCGDVLSSPQLSPIATYEGRIVGRNIVEGPKHKPDYASIPTCVCTVPALVSVGLTEAAAEEKRLKMKVHISDMEYWFSTRTYAETKAWAKVTVDQTSDRILGAHIVGHAGEELINLFGLAMPHGITASEIRNFVFAFPTFSADIKSML